MLGVLPIQRNKSAWLAALEQSRHLFYHLHGKYFGMRQQHCSQQEQEYYDEDQLDQQYYQPQPQMMDPLMQMKANSLQTGDELTIEQAIMSDHEIQQMI